MTNSSVLNPVTQWWKNRGKLNDDHFETLYLDFQPEALAIQNRPPHPASKLVARILICLFVFGVVWACCGHVDILASAQGRLIPHSRIKVVQALELGKVTQLHITEGQAVKQGDILIEIDTTQINADVIRIESQLNDFKLRAMGLALLITQIEQDQNRAMDSVEKKQFNTVDFSTLPKNYHPWLKSQWQDYLQQQQLLLQQQNTQHHTIATSEALVAKHEQTLPIIRDRAHSLKTMHDRQLVSKLEYLNVEQERIEMAQDLLAERKRLSSIKSELQGLKSQLSAYRASAQKDWQKLKLDYEQEAQRLHQELQKARDRLKKQTLYSPVDGLVKNLSITTIGAVVSPADELMSIVPTADTLQMEAYIENKDIGFIEEGQSVEVKINTFNFTKYGIIEGRLIHISDDAIQDEQKGFVFPIRIELKKDYLYFNGKKLKLQPGMEATVEIKTGKRRLIEFFLSPLLRHKAESLNER
ncbi:MAG: HlyD family type I secretion periplasmic adaptor subunit [Spongiibacteraceae bacterium]|nr:HlyD family type I secretion periplasmic adaptor subunit [Spongiibacteraceae bacterium]